MSRKKNKGLNSIPVATRKRKSSVDAVNTKTVDISPKPVSPIIVLRCLADIYGVDKKSLSFAVAKTADGEGGFDLLPVVLIANSDEYIDLLHCVKASARRFAAGAGKHNFFDAVVRYDNGDFVFLAPQAVAKVNKSTLIKHYGTAVIAF